MNKISGAYRIFQVVNTIFLLMVVISTLYPFLYVFSVSFSSEKFIYAGKISFYPRGFDTTAYRVMFAQISFWVGYKNSVLYTVTATIVSLIMSTMLAYPLSKKRLAGRQIVMRLVIFTMFFTGGLIPSYLVVNSLGMTNKIWAIIIPGAINTFNLILMRTYFEGLPEELEEAAAIDGMNTYGILLRIILPLSKPIMATMTLYYAVAFWNDWFRPFVYLNDLNKLPVSVFLRNIVVGSSRLTQEGGAGSQEEAIQIAATVQSAAIILVALPILSVYPFIQKYFIKGTLIGAVKG